MEMFGWPSWSYPACSGKGWWRSCARGLAITVVAKDSGYERLTRVALAQAGSLARAPKE